MEKLDQYGIPNVTLVATDLQQALNLHDTGLNVVVGKSTTPRDIQPPRAQDAAMVVVMNDDVASTNIIFTIREVTDTVPVISNADQEDSVDIIDLAGSAYLPVHQKTRGGPGRAGSWRRT